MSNIKTSVSYSDDISALLTLALETLDYENDLLVRYSFLIEEALLKWKESGLDEQELLFSRSDTKNDVNFSWEVAGPSCDPFAIDAATCETDCLSKMKDLLLSGVGNEIKYKYSKDTKTNIITLSLPKQNHTERLFKQNLIHISIPLVLQSIMLAIATYVDSFMVGFLDVNAMSAVSQLSHMSTPTSTLSDAAK